jgi:hypothetical protein
MNYEYHKAGIQLVGWVLLVIVGVLGAFALFGVAGACIGWLVAHLPWWTWAIFWPLVGAGAVYGLGYAFAMEQAEMEAFYANLSAPEKEIAEAMGDAP